MRALESKAVFYDFSSTVGTSPCWGSSLEWLPYTSMGFQCFVGSTPDHCYSNSYKSEISRFIWMAAVIKSGDFGQKLVTGGWREGSVLNSACSSSRGPGLGLIKWLTTACNSSLRQSYVARTHMQVLICIKDKNKMKQKTPPRTNMIKLQHIHRLWKCHNEIHHYT